MAKLLLKADLENFGRSGDIVNVKPGFARNYLLPQGIAVVANKQTLKLQARLQEERRKKAADDLQESQKVASQLENIVLKTFVKVDHDGHMYGSVSAQDIVNLLQEQHNVTVEKRNIILKHAIKTTGKHKITLKLKEGVSVDNITLKVTAEGSSDEDTEEPVEGAASEA